jgi:hypothetical protein
VSTPQINVPGATTEDMAAGCCVEPGCWYYGQRDLVEEFTVREVPGGVEFTINALCERGHPFAFSVQTARNARDLLAHTLGDLRDRQAPEVARLKGGRMASNSGM